MPVSDDSTLARLHGAAPVVARLAEILGCPIEAFTDSEHVPADLRDVPEVIRLWGAISDPAARQRVLALLRELAGK